MPLTMARLQSHWAAACFVLTAVIPGHLFGWGVEWGFAAVTTVLGAMLFHQFSARFPAVARGGLVLVAVLTLIALASYLRTAFGGRFDTGGRDFIDVVKPAMIFFTCAGALAFGLPTLGAVRRAALIVLLFALFWFAVLYWQVPGLYGIGQALYGETKTHIGQYVVRLSIPFENPNFLGLLAVLSLIVGLNFGTRPALALVACALVCAGLSGSRTAWIVSAFVLLMLALDHGWRIVRHWQVPSLRSQLLAALLVAAAVWILPDLLASYQRLADLVTLLSNLDLSQDASYLERIELRRKAIGMMVERPWFGWGAYKYSELEVLDNQYFGMLLRYGVIGTAAIGAATACLFLRYRHAFAGRAGVFVPSMLMWLVCAAYLWNGNFLENIRMITLMTLLIAATTTEVADA